ncbi:ABC transporter permease [Pandoraea oxalativorans]|uniref:ABC transporter permease n=1 Tax=Pandoraea oxalativorans TaxID=573737 RepID=UPI001FE1D391|nr:ABC transporter permease [Pandoraea oxalativorans]
MIRYLTRRVAQSLITVLLVTLVIFLIVRLIGDPTHLMLPPEATEADRALLRHEMGLDRPVALQYGSYLWHLLQGQLGISYRFSRPALDVVLGALGPTLLLTTSALGLGILVGVPLGAIAAVRRGGAIDQCAKLLVHRAIAWRDLTSFRTLDGRNLPSGVRGDAGSQAAGVAGRLAGLCRRTRGVARGHRAHAVDLFEANRQGDAVRAVRRTMSPGP